MILSMFSIPLISLCFPGFSLDRLISFAKDLYRISLIKVDFPEPETPVTQTNCPKGIRTLIFFRLFSFAPIISMYFLLLFLLCFGTNIFFFPLKYCPVIDSGTNLISSAVPCATTFPPCTPAPGPISII